jgi:hypothetical protein
MLHPALQEEDAMNMHWLAAYLYPRLKAWTERDTTKPPQIITDGTGANRPYLRRWRIVDSTWWHPGCYLHNMVLSDDSSLHDHPYASISIVLWGFITEYYNPEPRSLVKRIWSMRTLGPGDIVWRSSTMAHQLVINKDGAWTLFIPFFRLKKGWGFYCPKGYRPFAKYHATRRAALAAGKAGNLIGCGE